MNTIYDRAPLRAAARPLLIMLPGAKARLQDLVQYGFVRAVRERGLVVDVIAVEAHLGYYLDGNLTRHLAHDIIAPVRKNYPRIWLMGISLGGMGALQYARAHPTEIEGVILLAPFLGTRGMIAEVVRAGGLARWQPGAIKADDEERQLLAWIKTYAPAPAYPEIYLGYGQDDRFAAASELLAERLPAARVLAMAGGHDWATWINLWRHWLDQDLFAGTQKPPRKPALKARQKPWSHNVL
ncbi:MAG: alpha/beta hydrolase [Betaproteobacteria bacterium]|nr:alpha/beta hydrolase [Betaproteobacteria bacterium]